MNLEELKEAVDSAIERANDCGESPKNIIVALQIEKHTDSIWSSDDVELHYDNNGNASGCVLTAQLDAL